MTNQARKKVRVKVSFQVYWEVPADWDDAQILFHLNESSLCTNSLLEEKLRDEEECSCFPYDSELVR